MNATADPPPVLSGDMTMKDVLKACPGAQRALFARYHIGGCQSCGFRPDETLAQVCERNDGLPLAEVIRHIQDSHASDAQLQIAPAELEQLRSNRPGLRLLDVRRREEHEAVKIPGSQLLTQDLIQEAFASWDKTDPLVIYDHQGSHALDAVAYFVGHGFANAKCLAGGIDAYSTEVDPSLPRYRIEFAD